MRFKLSKILKSFPQVLTNEDGQDIVEYAMVIAVIAFGAMASMNALASNIALEFTTLGSMLTNAV